MRILHVVTLLSPDAAYGGPVRVAVNQATSLIDRGHDVVIAAAARGYDHLPTSVGGVPVRAFTARTTLPGIGFAGTRGAGMTRWIAENASGFDVVHVHLARDFVTLPAARTCLGKRVPVVAQTHGMIDPSARVLAKPLDLSLTRPVLRSAAAVFHLTARERQDLCEVAGHLDNLRELPNGVPLADPGDGSSATEPPEVLFLARLAPRKRAGTFVEMARLLIERGGQGVFALVGPDEGTAGDVTELISRCGLGSRVHYEGALSPDDTIDRMRRASVYVLPAIDEPFPMSVLEAMSVGLPVVVTDTCGLAPLIDETASGIVVGTDVDSLAEAVELLLGDALLRRTMGDNARRTVSKTLGMPAVAERLERAYEDAVRTAHSR